MKSTIHRIFSLVLALALCASLVPSSLAAQPTGYRDPAEHWLSAGSRTNELDANAVITHETFHCHSCGLYTSFTIWRCPEYTKDGATALSRNVRYSDGTLVGGEGKGVLMDATPESGGIWTHYHWTKSMCDACGALNSNQSTSEYDFEKNLYGLNDCAGEFYENLDEIVTYESAGDTYHTKTVDGGYYCEFCFGTDHTHTSALEKHDLKIQVVPEIGNQRFVVTESCADCDYTNSEYVAAKSVITDYYGTADGQAHTLLVSDLSESGVSTKIRYGTSAAACDQITPPSYTDKGQYAVYYKITYTYQGKSMTENGVSYVWLLDSSDNRSNTTIVYRGHGSNSNTGNSTDSGQNSAEHSFSLLETVSPTCTELGYSRYLCAICGEIEQRDFVNATGHDYQTVVIREADCDHAGKVMEICRNCGDVKETVTPKGAHQYVTKTIAATCTAPGYTLKECAVCGDRTITNITPALNHSYEETVIAATCESGGKTVHTCATCGSSFVTDYTQPTGHQWDSGKTITTATCTGEGVVQHTCAACGETYIEARSAKGHNPGPAADCTSDQLCLDCGAVLAKAHGHDYKPEVTAPTCTEMGYTTYTCADCGASYKSDYTNPTGHKAGDWIVDREPTTGTEGSRHKECRDCGAVLETGTIDKLYWNGVTDSHGEAVVDGYLVIVTDAEDDAPVSNASISLNKDGSISVKLPDGRLLDYDGQTTVTVLRKADSTPVKDLLIVVTDKNGNYASGRTNKAGQITVPVTSGQTSNNGNSTVGREDADGQDITLTVRIVNAETGRPIEDATAAIGKTGNITVTLPEGIDMDENNRITVIVTDNRGNPQEGNTIIIKNDLNNNVKGQTDKDGSLTVPAVEVTERHGAYVLGYPDGSFGPERSMTRCEAATIFARLLAERKGESIPTTAATKYKDVTDNAWFSGYVKYLTSYGVVYGDDNNKFRPYDDITRAEFVTIVVRFFEVYGDGDAALMEKYATFSDVSEGYWAANYIKDAAVRGWIKGYGDGTFRGSQSITRAEAVTLTNRMLGRTADESYIDKNLRRLNTFVDMEPGHWAYYDVMESANGHTATMTDSGEIWSK